MLALRAVSLTSVAVFLALFCISFAENNRFATYSPYAILVSSQLDDDSRAECKHINWTATLVKVHVYAQK